MTDSKLPSVRITQDGSPTLQLANSEVTFHSIYGALTEAQHVFIEQGIDALNATDQSEIRVLEVGFGTGLNAALTLLWARKNKCAVHYQGLEPYPLPRTFWDGFSQEHWSDEVSAALQELHSKCDTKGIHTIENSTFQVDQIRVEEFVSCEELFDVVYYDAFAPSHDPALWTAMIFKRLRQMVRPGGLLVTFCSKGIVRRNLISAGWEVEQVPGAPGKKEMLRAMHHPVSRFNVRVYGMILDAEGERVLICNERFADGSCAQKFPGGGVELGEGVMDAWWRECQEELGCQPVMKSAQLFHTSASFVRSAFRRDDQLIALYYTFQLQSNEGVSWTEEPTVSPGGESNVKVSWKRINALDFTTFRFPSDQSAVRELVALKGLSQ